MAAIQIVIRYIGLHTFSVMVKRVKNVILFIIFNQQERTPWMKADKNKICT